MTSLSSGFSIQAENGMYWSNDLSVVFGTSNINTMLINDKKDLFKFVNTGTGGKYIASLKLNVYLRWDEVAPRIVVRPSSVSLSTAWTAIPQDEQRQLTFRYVTVDNNRVFQLQPGDQHSGNSQYIRRYNMSGINYIFAQNEDDIFTHFIKA